MPPGQALAVDYRVGAAEDLVAEGARFPVITALEVIEHVADPAAFLGLARRACSSPAAACSSPP